MSGQVSNFTTGLMGGVHTLKVGGISEVRYKWSGHTDFCQSWECALLLSQLHCIHTYIHALSISLTYKKLQKYQCIFPRRKLLFTCIFFFLLFAQLSSYLCVRVVSVELCTQRPHTYTRAHTFTHILSRRQRRHKHIGNRAVSSPSSLPPRRLPFFVEHKQRATGDVDSDDSNCMCVRAE